MIYFSIAGTSIRKPAEPQNGTAPEMAKNGINIMFPASFRLQLCRLWDSAENFQIKLFRFLIRFRKFFRGKTAFQLENQHKNIYIPS